MKGKLSEPVALMAIGAAIALIALWGRGAANDQAALVFYAGVAMAGIGAAWWLGKGHVRGFQQRRQSRRQEHA